MKKNILFAAFLAILIVVSQTACNKNSDKNPEISVFSASDSTVDKSEIVYNYLEKTGNFINSQEVPPLITAEELFAEGSNYLVVDIRSFEEYTEGHIDGAVHTVPSEIITFFADSIYPANYEKVVLACHTGQTASYAAMFLRLLGYGNVYVLKWGMCSWDKNLAADKWVKSVSSAYVSKIETKQNHKQSGNKYPAVKSSKNTGFEIIAEKAQKLLANIDFKVSAEKVFADPTKYYIINYWPQEHYEVGHIAGAFQYEPKNSLTRNTKLSTIPTDKPVLLYCYTGQHAAFAVAYLRLLGYDAYSLTYGAHSFMASKLSSEKLGHPFNTAEIKNFPLTTGTLPSLNSPKSSGSSTSTDNSASAVKLPTVKKKKESAGGGC